MNVDDDDSDNDSDYVPGDDEEKDVEQKETVLLNIASNKRKRQASALWDEICVEDHEYVTSKLSKSAFRYTDQLFEEPPRRVRAKIRRYFKQLAGRRADGPEDSPDEDKTANKDEMHADLRKELVEAFQRVKRKTVVTESRKFAGQEIQVQKVVSVSKAEERPADQAADTQLDKVLQQMKGPKAISTVTKSAIDWDQYKEKEGLSDDITAAAKDGFRGRQGFLQACDVRSFEIEREQRALNRDK